MNHFTGGSCVTVFVVLPVRHPAWELDPIPMLRRRRCTASRRATLCNQRRAPCWCVTPVTVHDLEGVNPSQEEPAAGPGGGGGGLGSAGSDLDGVSILAYLGPVDPPPHPTQ